MINVDVMQDASEIVHYDESGIPLYIRRGVLSHYPDMRALCHWHEDLEWIFIQKGEMYYEINGKRVLLQEGDCILVNSTQMHYGFEHKMQECEFICILFHPDLLYCNKLVYERYVEPIIRNHSIEYLYFPESSAQGLLFSRHLQEILSLKEKHPAAYELDVMEHFYAIWKELYLYCQEHFFSKEENTASDISLQKKMVSFIYQHFTEALSLDEIAAAGNISRSKCCIIFKRYLNQSPIDFLNSYRLEVARNLLKSTDYSITRIATACGFNHLSYFSKMFERKYGYTPSNYRKQ